MVDSKDMFYFLNWKLYSPPLDSFNDLTQGNEVIEIFIQDVYGCQPRRHYTIPIVQAGQSFSSLRANLLYEKNACTGMAKDIFVSIRILRGIEQRIIFTNDFILSAAYYMNRNILPVPIYRVWYPGDYLRLLLPNSISWE